VTDDQIIRTLDQVSAAIGLATLRPRAVSLVIGGIGIANVMIVAVTRGRGRSASAGPLGARRSEVLRQFLLEAAFLSGVGGLAGVLVASLLGLLITLFAPGFSAVAPAWASPRASEPRCSPGSWRLPPAAGGLPRPVEALRYE